LGQGCLRELGPAAQPSLFDPELSVNAPRQSDRSSVWISGPFLSVKVTGVIRRALDEGFRVRAMPPASVKGKPELIQTYYVEPMGAQCDAGSPTEMPDCV
jgi:hypothetical protein